MPLVGPRSFIQPAVQLTRCRCLPVIRCRGPHVIRCAAADPGHWRRVLYASGANMPLVAARCCPQRCCTPGVLAQLSKHQTKAIGFVKSHQFVCLRHG